MRTVVVFAFFLVAASATFVIKNAAEPSLPQTTSKFIITQQTTPAPTPTPTPEPCVASLGCELGRPCSDRNPCTSLDTCLPTDNGNRCLGRAPRRCPPVPNDCYEDAVWEPSFDLRDCRCRYAFKPANTPCGDDRVCNGQGHCIMQHDGVEVELEHPRRHRRHHDEHPLEHGEEAENCDEDAGFEHGDEDAGFEHGDEDSDPFELVEEDSEHTRRRHRHHRHHEHSDDDQDQFLNLQFGEGGLPNWDESSRFQSATSHAVQHAQDLVKSIQFEYSPSGGLSS